MVFDGEPSYGMPPPEKLSVTLTFEHMTFKMSSCHVDLIMSNCDEFIEIHPCIPEIGNKMPPKVFV